MPRAVDIIIPVYGNFEDARRAIDAALSARNQTPAHLVVINDASPQTDAPAFFASLPADRLTLLENPKNLGFVATVNRGMRLNDDRDVVLLNSDTMVFDGWLDRMVAAAATFPRVATVTPMSNAATILSYPEWLVDHAAPLEIGWRELDALCERLAAPPQQIPTGVGFCMLIRREAILEVGLFDAETFGQGYGEENDFCLRASREGFVNLAAPNVFVWHRGGGSFGPARAAKCANAQRLIEERHPGYAGLIQRYIAGAPMRATWAALDALRLRSSARRKMLVFGAAAPTTTPDMPAPDTPDLQILRLEPEGPFWRRRWRLSAPGFGPTPNLPQIDRRTPPNEIEWLLRETGVERVLVVSPRLGARAIAGKLAQAAAALSLPTQLS